MYFTISSFLHTTILPFLGSTSRQYVFLELMAGVEPATSSLPRMRSTTELHQQHRIGSATARKYERIKKSSGKRGSNPRPPAWKASALSTELFPRINHDFRDGYFCGSRWIRTTEGENQQIYSLPHLAALEYSQYLIFQSSTFLEPLVGFEPTTPRLQITCSGQLS